MNTDQNSLTSVNSHVLILFKDRFEKYGIEFAVQHGRSYRVLSSSSLDSDSPNWIDADSVTFLGERYNFSFAFFRDACALQIPFGIITARDKHQLMRILSALNPSEPIAVSYPFLKNIFSADDKDIIYSSIENADILMLGLHGDALCVSLGNAILCSKNNKANKEDDIIQKLPACMVDGDCFRKKRLGQHDESKIINIEALKAKAVIFNTCAGFAIHNTKYGDFPGLLPIRLSECGVQIYVSSFLIKPSYAEEIYLYWALLRSYRSFAHTTLLFNHIRMIRLGAEPSFVMLGDGITKIDDYFDAEAVIWRVEQTTETLTVLEISSYSKGTVHLSFENNMFPMMKLWTVSEIVGFIDAQSDATLAIYSINDESRLEIIIYFHDKYILPFRIFLITKKLISESIDSLNKRAGNLPLTDILRVVDYQEPLSQLAIEIIEELNNIILFSSLCELNARKYLLIQIKIGEIFEQLDKFEILLSESILKTSSTTDTPLIINDNNVCLMSPYKEKHIVCPICDNNQVTYYFHSRKQTNLHIMQTVCPRCEIVAVTTNHLIKLSICAPEVVCPGETLSITVEIAGKIIDSFEGSVGLALISTSLGASKRKLITGEGLILSKIFRVPSGLKSGLYYLRGWMIGLTGITIAHKHLYVCQMDGGYSIF